MIGDRYTFWIKTAIGSDTPIRLYPNWEYSERTVKTRQFKRSQGGQLNTYTLVGSHEEYSLPLSIVNSSESTVINSWWETQTQLHFTINDSVTPYDGYFILDDSFWGLLDKEYNPLIDFVIQSNKVVRISNVNKPFTVNRENKFTDFDGLVFLVTVN